MRTGLVVAMSLGFLLIFVSVFLIVAGTLPKKQYPWADEYKVTSPNDVWVKVRRDRPQDYRRMVDLMAFTVHMRTGARDVLRVHLVDPVANLSNAPNVKVTCMAIAEGGILTHTCN